MRYKSLAEYRRPFDAIASAGRAATEAYEKGARFFDQMKETLLLEYGLVHTSNMFHKTAHWFPGEFDTLGDILHQLFIMQDYGATPELPERPATVGEHFSLALDVLHDIEKALTVLVRVCDEQAAFPLARQVETLIARVSEKQTAYLTAWKMFEEADSATSFDSWVLHMTEGGG